MMMVTVVVGECVELFSDNYIINLVWMFVNNTHRTMVSFFFGATAIKLIIFPWFPLQDGIVLPPQLVPTVVGWHPFRVPVTQFHVKI